MWKNTLLKRSGFTLVELLIVIAIVGILATVTVVSLTQARRRSRDTGRLANIKSIQNALELYYNNRADYPSADVLTILDPLILGSAGAKCLDSSNAGFQESCIETPILNPVPADTLPGLGFRYTKPDAREYAIAFELEGEIGDLRDTDGNSVINCTATPQGITCN